MERNDGSDCLFSFEGLTAACAQRMACDCNSTYLPKQTFWNFENAIFLYAAASLRKQPVFQRRLEAFGAFETENLYARPEVVWHKTRKFAEI
ncbi:MAG: hypothetical protein HFF17_09220 [Oscillospiraceae bacterium]|nr:hypothetical protein [Oscillospiraceae bacterium]